MLGTTIAPQKTIDPVDRLYVIGDIHGCHEELEVLLDEIVLNHDFQKENCHLVFTGDYVDRGPDTKAVIQKLIDFNEIYPNITFLMGNHEDMMLAYMGIEGHFNGNYFLCNGGDATLRNYDMWGSRSINKMPFKHKEFFLKLLNYVAYVNPAGQKYTFTHTAIDPEVYITDQNTYDLMWNRKQIRTFYEIGTAIDEGYISVHGHTPVKRVKFDLPYQINVDTGCCFDGMIIGDDRGKLACLIINGDTTYKTITVTKGDHVVGVINYDKDANLI